MEDAWQTVTSRAEEKKKQRQQKKLQEPKEEDLTNPVDPGAAAFAAFDQAFAAKAAAEEEQQQAQQQQSYQGAFAGLREDEAPQQHDADDGTGSGDDEIAQAAASIAPAAAKQPKQPKVKKPKVSVAQVAEGVDVTALQYWWAEVQLRYSTNETAQVEALSDRLLVAFREAQLDLPKLLATKGLDTASAHPLCDVPHALMNALASCVASVSESALVAVTVPLAAAVIEAAAAAAPGPSAPGKSKAGVQIMLGVILRTRPQVLVAAAAGLRAAGQQLSGAGRLPLLLWIINQAALADPAVGVAVWVRMLLPQLLGVTELPSAAAAAGSSSKGSSISTIPAGLAGDLQRPLESSLQAPAVEYLSDLLQQLDVLPLQQQAAGGVGGKQQGGDVVCGDGGMQPTVPGSAVELLSRLVAGPAAAAGGAAASSSEGKKAAAARAAAAAGLAPLLPALTALAASTSCEQQYSEWLLAALESAGLSAGSPELPDELVVRSAAHVVACLCASGECFAVWESKHKASLRGSARILAATEQQPHLLQPLRKQPASVAAFRQLLAALPARHRTHLASGKGWQGACARVAEDACHKLPRRLGRGTSPGLGGPGIIPMLGAAIILASIVVMLGLYRTEVCGIVQAHAGKETAEKVDAALLTPLADVLQQAAPYVQKLQLAVEPVVAPVQQAAAPLVAAAWERVQRLVSFVAQQVEEADTTLANNGDGVDIALEM